MPGNVAAVYTVGYAGRSAKGLLGALVEARVDTVVDIRRNPVSRVPGFSKSALSDFLAAAGISYVGCPDLGIASAERRGVTTEEERATLLRSYGDRVRQSQMDRVQELARVARNRAMALLCMESDPECCHRSVLASILSEETGLPVMHL